MNKTCSKCKETKPIEAFPKDASKKGGYHNQCRDCRRPAKTAYKKAHADKQRAYANAYMRRRYRDRADWLASIKTGPCLDCLRGDIPSYCYDYDHRPDEIKSFEIGAAIANFSISKEMILEEMKKCDLVCAVCHRIRTASRLSDRTSLSDDR